MEVTKLLKKLTFLDPLLQIMGVFLQYHSYCKRLNQLLCRLFELVQLLDHYKLKKF